MSKESFKNAIFNVVEYVNRYELSDHAKKLIIHYFNESKANSSSLKAIDAVQKYLQENLPGDGDTPPRLAELIDTMVSEADYWDSD